MITPTLQRCRNDVSFSNYSHPELWALVQGDLHRGANHLHPQTQDENHQLHPGDAEQPIQAGPLGNGLHSPYKQIADHLKCSSIKSLRPLPRPFISELTMVSALRPVNASPNWKLLLWVKNARNGAPSKAEGLHLHLLVSTGREMAKPVQTKAILQPAKVTSMSQHPVLKTAYSAKNGAPKKTDEPYLRLLVSKGRAMAKPVLTTRLWHPMLKPAHLPLSHLLFASAKPMFKMDCSNR